MPSELFYFSLPAPDLAKSKAFYKNVLEWQVGGGSLGGHVSNINTPGGLSPATIDTNECVVYLTTSNLQQSMKDVDMAGGSVTRVEDFPVGKCAFCMDDQGTHFALQEPSKDLQEHATHPPKGRKHGDLFFFSLPVMDAAKAKVFFRAVLGWEFGEPGSKGGMGIKNISGPDGGIGACRPGVCPGLWFRVDDLEKACSDVKKAGGTAGVILQGPEGNYSDCLDNQGVKFSLIEPAPGY